MDGCVASSGGLTFERGALASGKRFEIDALEVWGVGGAEALARAAEAEVSAAATKAATPGILRK